MPVVVSCFGVMCVNALRFQWLWPPHFSPTHPLSLHPPVTPILNSSDPLFFLTHPSEEITLYFRCRSSEEPHWEPSSPPLRCSSPPSRLWCYPSRSYSFGGGHRKTECLLTITKSFSLAAELSLSCLLCHFSKTDGKNMHDALREFAFPSGTECVSHIMRSSSLSQPDIK